MSRQFIYKMKKRPVCPRRTTLTYIHVSLSRNDLFNKYHDVHGCPLVQMFNICQPLRVTSNKEPSLPAVTEQWRLGATRGLSPGAPVILYARYRRADLSPAYKFSPLSDGRAARN